MFIIPSVACCKLLSPLCCIAKSWDNASLTWTCSILLFVNVQKISSLPNHCIRVCVKGKRINCGVGYGLEIPAEYIFYGNKKAFQWAKITLDGVDGNMIKKVLRCLK